MLCQASVPPTPNASSTTASATGRSARSSSFTTLGSSPTLPTSASRIASPSSEVAYEGRGLDRGQALHPRGGWLPLDYRQKALAPPPTNVGQEPQPSTTVRSTWVAWPLVARRT